MGSLHQNWVKTTFKLFPPVFLMKSEFFGERLRTRNFSGLIPTEKRYGFGSRASTRSLKFLLKLADDVDLTIYTPACLPEPDDDYTGKKGNVYGELEKLVFCPVRRGNFYVWHSCEMSTLSSSSTLSILSPLSTLSTLSALSTLSTLQHYQRCQCFQYCQLCVNIVTPNASLCHFLALALSRTQEWDNRKTNFKPKIDIFGELVAHMPINEQLRLVLWQ